VTTYVVAPAAKADIDEIALYIAAADRAAAERFIDEIYDAFDLLALQPGLGHYRRDLTDRPVRFWTVMRRYMIVYRDRSPVEIVRVLSGYRDIAALLA
jgi:plasmid stabilization system protein ParE